MGDKKAGGYIFRSYIGDHRPYHVHIRKDGKEIGRWDIEHQRSMDGLVITNALKRALLQLGYLKET